MVAEIVVLFNTLFDSASVLALAKKLGAVVRLRKIHPLDFCSALTSCALGDEVRSIATARRKYNSIAGFMPEESSFYDRFTEGALLLLQELFSRTLNACTREHRQNLAKLLGSAKIVDMLAVDGSQITLPASAAEKLPSTCDKHGGLKLTATLSILYQNLVGVQFTNARTHDRKAWKLPRWLHGTLYLFDRGYSDYKLFADIDNKKGFFLTPLKKSARPKIDSIRSGLANAHVGEALNRALFPFCGPVDLNAWFAPKGRKRKSFRVVRLQVPTKQQGAADPLIDIWLVTNLPLAIFSAEQLGLLYRFRWEVEYLFKVLKTVGRLDHLRTQSLVVIGCFMFATLLGLVLSQDICARMRRHRPALEPSLMRVNMLLLGYWSDFMSAAASGRFDVVAQRFVDALWREGKNPNPGRCYKSTKYALEVAGCA